MNVPNILECLREYLADGGSREVYNDALKELYKLKKAAEHCVHPTKAAAPVDAELSTLEDELVFGENL